jgi:predicted MFS family arabinose efflux permease
VLFLLVGALLAWRVRVERPQPTGKSVFGDLADGVRYVRGSPTIKALLVMQLLPGLLLIGPFRVTAVAIVQDVLHESDKFVGLLSGGFGIGVLAGSMALTAIRIRRRGLLLCLAPIPGGIIFVAYGLSEHVAPSLALMVPWGLSAAIFINMVSPLLQEASTPEMLGRVMSMSSLCFAISTPLGFAHSGVIASAWGPQESVILSGATFAAIGVLCVLFLRPVRRLQ